MSKRRQRDPVLCYVRGAFAYFTTAPVTEQWGDDWDDAPYEHNAGAPYDHHGHKIVKVAWEGPWETPADRAGLNSRWSVQDINRGAIAWLLPSPWTDDDNVRPIPAGTTLTDFIAAIRAGGGRVFLEVQP